MATSTTRMKRATKTRFVLAGAVLLATGAGAAGVIGATAASAADVTYSSSPTDVRSKFAWPFSRDSIWNTPIGSGAHYVAAGLQPANAWYGQITADPEQIGVNPADPARTLSAPGQAGNGDSVRVPSTMSHDGSWNGCSTLLRADNSSVWSGQPLTLAAGGNPSWTWTTQSKPVDLKGPGLEGCHGGSHLSGLGGSLRVGELNSTAPLRHALKINLDGQRFLYHGSSEAASFRWPAFNADSCWSSCYKGTNPALRMGALLAVPPNADLSGITDLKAKKIAIALRDFGGYVVDNTDWDVHALNMDERMLQSGEFPTSNTAFHSQLQAVFQKLAVVDNNAPTSVGGGGTPRAPLAPCFSDDTTCTSAGSTSTSTGTTSPSPAPSPSATTTSPTPSPSPTAATTTGSTAPAGSTTWLSALAPTSATNGWGPYERDLSNGEQNAGDGRTLTLNGTTYSRGLGVHAGSSLTYALPAGTTQFRATVGVDDEAAGNGSVQFEVWADGVLRQRSAVLTGTSASQALTVDVSGASTLRLVMNDGGNGATWDHGDWASAQLVGGTASSTGTVTSVSALAPTSASNGWGPYERNMSNGEQNAGDGRTLTLNGTTYGRGLGVHAGSSLTYALPAGAQQFRATVGVDDEAGSNGSVQFEVWADGVLRQRTAVLTGASASQSLLVDVSGASTLRLVVTDGGNGNAWDHGDWAAADILS